MPVWRLAPGRGNVQVGVMARSRRFALLRALAALLLVCAGFDIGVHVVSVSHLGQLPSSGSVLRLSSTGGVGASEAVPDSCFCNGVSSGAVAPAPTASLALLGRLDEGPSLQPLRTRRFPLYHPPRPAA